MEFRLHHHLQYEFTGHYTRYAMGTSINTVQNLFVAQKRPAKQWAEAMTNPDRMIGEFGLRVICDMLKVQLLFIFII